MERLRKWAAWAAAAVTVLITAVFCYMPVREVIRETNRKTVSLEQEGQTGETEKGTTDREEDVASAPEKGADREKEPQAGEMLPLGFSVERPEGRFETFLWQSSRGIYYVFLPGFAEDKEIRVQSVPGKSYVTLAGSRLEERDGVRDISYGEPYGFAVYDKDDSLTLEGELVFLCSSDLPVVSLTTESESMEWIEEAKGNEEAGEVAVLEEDGRMLYQGKADSISGRGNSTFGLSKKPFQFKLEEKADLFGFGMAQGYNLLADGYDETKLRNRIALGLAEELGMAVVPQGKTVDLYCNGIYYGVYYLCEKVEVAENRVEIADLEEHSASVYGKSEKAQITAFQNEDGSRRWTDVQIEEEDVTGGYLFERELTDRYEEEVSGFATSQGDCYVLKSPKYATLDQVNYIAGLMQEFQDAVAREDGVNRNTGRHYSEYIDVDSFVQKYLVEEISKNYDGGVTSSYFYKPSDEESTRIYAGPVWDYDVAFGNCNLDEIASDPKGITRLNDHVLGTEIFARLYEKEEFYRKVVSLYESRALPYLERLLSGEIDRMAKEVAEAVRLDRIRWEALENRYRYYEEYENEIRYLKYFIEERKNFLNRVWLEGLEYHRVTFVVDGEPWKQIYVEDGETAGRAPVPVRYNSLFMEWLSESHDVPYDEYKPVYEDMVFYAAWQQLPEADVVLTS